MTLLFRTDVPLSHCLIVSLSHSLMAYWCVEMMMAVTAALMNDQNCVLEIDENLQNPCEQNCRTASNVEENLDFDSHLCCSTWDGDFFQNYLWGEMLP